MKLLTIAAFIRRMREGENKIKLRSTEAVIQLLGN